MKKILIILFLLISIYSYSVVKKYPLNVIKTYYLTEQKVYIFIGYIIINNYPIDAVVFKKDNNKIHNKWIVKGNYKIIVCFNISKKYIYSIFRYFIKKNNIELLYIKNINELENSI